jgi:hypothetical protein
MMSPQKPSREEARQARLDVIQAKISARDAAEAAAAVAGMKVTAGTAGGTIYLGRLGHRVALGPDGIVLRKRNYPVKGAHAEVSDFRSGLVGRKHTVDLTITLVSGEVLTWHQTDTGMVARATHNEALKFAAAVNSAAAR